MKVTLVQVSAMFDRIYDYCDKTFNVGCRGYGNCILQECPHHLGKIELDIQEDDFVKLKSADERVRKEG